MIKYKLIKNIIYIFIFYNNTETFKLINIIFYYYILYIKKKKIWYLNIFYIESLNNDIGLLGSSVGIANSY